MKKALVIAVTVTALATVNATARAAVSTQKKQEFTAIGLITAGTVAAGPAGALVGVLAGSWLAEEIGRAGERDEALASLAASSQDLSTANQRVASLSRELAAAEAEQQRLANAMLDSLDVELMFRTGESGLSSGGQSRLKSLASYLKANPDVQVRVQGFADARGTTTDNLALSQARADAVAEHLIASGVLRTRLSVNGYGEQHAIAKSGDADAMAMERKVVIELNRERGLAGRIQP